MKNCQVMGHRAGPAEVGIEAARARNTGRLSITPFEDGMEHFMLWVPKIILLPAKSLLSGLKVVEAFFITTKLIQW